MWGETQGGGQSPNTIHVPMGVGLCSRPFKVPVCTAGSLEAG